MKILPLIAVACALALPLAAPGQTTVFSDNFSTSTLNPTAANPGTLNASTTAYEIGSSKNATTTTIAGGLLTISTAATTSGYTEAQALFTATPVTLSAANQSIEIYYTFTDATDILNSVAGNNEEINLGLYNSGGGSEPTNGMALWNAGLTSSVLTATNGGCKGWVGYNGEFAWSSNSVQASAIGTRPAQTAANNTCQGLGYNSGYASGANVITSAGVLQQPLLTIGNQYTMDLKITYVNATTLAITNTLYNGAGVGGTVFSSGGWTGKLGAQTGSVLTDSFDGLEVGIRPTGAVATTLKISNITVVEYIPAAPTIAGLTNQTIIQGSNAVLSATLTGTPNPGLQWYYSTDGGGTSNSILGATSSSLPLNNVQYSQNNYIYTLVATNSQGSVASNMTLTVIVPPAISGLSSSASGSVGDTISFSPTVTGVPTPALQWQTNGVNLADGPDANGSIIAGSQTGTLSIINAQAADSATYSLIASNSAGITTNSVTLTVSAGNVLPSFAGPYNQTNLQGSSATFTVSSVSGVPTPTLQWLDQTLTPIPGQTGLSLNLANVQYSQNGFTYYLVASNSVGSVTNGATLTVIVPPFIITQPANLVVTNTQAASFTVVETGGEPMPTYQWYKGSNPISGALNASATNATLILASVAPSDAGSYYVQISNIAGTTNSSPATLTVNSTMAVASVSPANGALNVCYDTPLYLTFDQPPTLQKAGTIRIYNVTNSAVAVDTINLSQSVDHTVTASYVDNAYNIQPRTIAGETFTNFPVIVTGNTAAIYPHLDLLTSNQTYYVTVDNGTFTDAQGANFAGITAANAWQFTTKATGPANPTNLVVDTSGNGDFVTVQGAVDSVPAGNTTPTVININSGVYTEIVDIHSKNNLLLRGQSRASTVVGYANNANLQGSTHYRMAFKVNGNNISLDNLTITNMTPVGGAQAEALMLESNVKHFILNNCNLGSYQDTLLANGSTGAQGYFNNDLIEGQFDYIWGGGDLYFTNCEMRTLLGYAGATTGGNVTASRTDNSANGNWPGYNGLSSSNGFSFVNCNFTRANGSITATTIADSNGSTNGNVAWINCSFDANYITPSAGVLNSQLLWEYDNSNLTDTASITFGLAVGDSAPALTGTDPRLLAAENSTTWLLGWLPQLTPNILTGPAPQSVSGGSTATFSVAATGIPDPAYQWLSNSVPIAGQTGSTLTIGSANANDDATYSVIVSNSAGTVTSTGASLNVGTTAPTLAPASDETVNVGANVSVANVATDPDVPANTLTFTLPQAPAGAAVDGSGNFTWRPTVSFAGTLNPVQVVVTDNGTPPLSATNNFNITVNPLTSPVTSAPIHAAGKFSITVNGQVGPDYELQVTTNLLSGTWTDVVSTNSPTSPFTLSDPNATGSMQFYRIVTGPPLP